MKFGRGRIDRTALEGDDWKARDSWKGHSHAAGKAQRDEEKGRENPVGQLKGNT